MPTRRPLYVGAVALVLVALAATALTTLLTRSDGPTRSAAAPPVSSGAPSIAAHDVDRSADTSLVAWLRGALPRDAPLSAAPALLARLRTAGFTDVRGLTGTTHSRWVAYPVADAADSTDSADVASERAASWVPVARLGTGHDAAVVAWAPDAGAARAGLLRDDLRKRTTAGAALAQNTALRASTTVRATIARGGLDPRAAALLALAAAVGPVQVVALPVSSAESTEQRPARTVVVSGGAPALTTAVNSLPVAQRPLRASTSGDGRTTLVWPVAVDPVRTVS